MAEDNTKNLRKALLMLGERYQQKAYNMIRAIRKVLAVRTIERKALGSIQKVKKL